jgi:ribonucleoside-diphosphate reductase beta chain
MIKTLAWQWEADSVASRSIIACFAPFISSSELFAAWQRISDNECIHAGAYSEIVRMSFDDPNKVMEDILSVKESLSRLSKVSNALGSLSKKGAQYTLGQLQPDQELYNAVYAGVATMLMLERIQFMSSFAITFTICDSGFFQPIGQAVKKICQDELQVHVELDKEVLRIENQTERGKIAKEQTKQAIKEIFEEIVESELKWTEYLFNNRELVGTNEKMIKQWVLFNAKDVARFLEIDTSYKFPSTNPMPGLEKWIDMNKQQAAPQEQDLAAYKVKAVVNDDSGTKFDVDF